MSWDQCKTLLRDALNAGYKVWPVPHRPGDLYYQISVWRADGVFIDLASGATWIEAARAAVTLIEADQVVRVRG